MIEVNKKNYTIIEMLVVISILGVLVALGAPAAIGMMTKQKSTAAKQEVQAIVQAFKAYEAEYGCLPFAKGTGAFTADLVTNIDSSGKGVDLSTQTETVKKMLGVLMNYPEDSVNNPKKIKFLKWIDRDEDNKPDNWLDPWGQPYVIGLDYDYDGRVAINDADGDGNYKTDSDGENLHGTIFVFSKGEDMLESVTASDNDVIEADFDFDNNNQIRNEERRAVNSDNVKSW